MNAARPVLVMRFGPPGAFPARRPMVRVAFHANDLVDALVYARCCRRVFPNESYWIADDVRPAHLRDRRKRPRTPDPGPIRESS